VSILIDGIDGYIKSLKRLNRETRAMPVAKTLESKMKAFKDALPLMSDLKHEALRERFVPLGIVVISIFLISIQ
jgi:dynein heavy chain